MLQKKAVVRIGLMLVSNGVIDGINACFKIICILFIPLDFAAFM